MKEETSYLHQAGKDIKSKIKTSQITDLLASLPNDNKKDYLGLTKELFEIPPNMLKKKVENNYKKQEPRFYSNVINSKSFMETYRDHCVIKYKITKTSLELCAINASIKKNDINLFLSLIEYMK